MPTDQDMQIKPLMLRLLNNHFEAIQMDNIRLEERAVSWEAFKRSSFDLYAHDSEMDASEARTDFDLHGGGRGRGKGRGRAPFTDIPGVTYDIGRYLSFVLRHGAVKEGISMDNEGYVKVEDILARKPHASIDSVLQAVNKCEKGRFELLQGEEGWLIRATQGHNKELDLSNEMHRQITTPDEVDQPTLFHGTNLAAWGSIRRQGLRCGHRQHVHFSTTYFANHGQSGMRPGCDLVVAVNVQQLLDAEMPLYKSTNGVYLVGRDIPPELLYNVYWARGPHDYRMIWQYGYCVLHLQIDQDEIFAAKSRSPGGRPLHNSLRTPLPRRRPLPRLRRDVSGGARLWGTEFTEQWRGCRLFLCIVCSLAYFGASGMDLISHICGDEYSYYSTDDEAFLQSSQHDEPTKREPAWRKIGKDRRRMKVHFADIRTFTTAPNYDRPREGTPPPAKTSGGDDQPHKRKRRKHKKIFVEDRSPAPSSPHKTG